MRFVLFFDSRKPEPLCFFIPFWFARKMDLIPKKGRSSLSTSKWCFVGVLTRVRGQDWKSGKANWSEGASIRWGQRLVWARGCLLLHHRAMFQRNDASTGHVEACVSLLISCLRSSSIFNSESFDPRSTSTFEGESFGWLAKGILTVGYLDWLEPHRAAPGSKWKPRCEPSQSLGKRNGTGK